MCGDIEVPVEIWLMSSIVNSAHLVLYQKCHGLAFVTRFVHSVHHVVLDHSALAIIIVNVVLARPE
jgi:hypothetical protein